MNRAARLPVCQFCLHPEPCSCEPLTPPRQPQRFVAVRMGGGAAQIVRHAGEIAGQPCEGEIDGLHDGTIGARAGGVVSNSGGCSE